VNVLASPYGRQKLFNIARTKKTSMDKLLFTPGPLTTSKTVKEAMLHDFGSRDTTFVNLIKEIRTQLPLLGNVSKETGYETVIMQGSGTFGVESVISSAVPKSGKLLIAINGAYGHRIATMAKIHQIPFSTIVRGEDQLITPQDIEAELAQNTYTHLAVIHCETTSGVINPVTEIGAVAAKHNLTYIVDSMSAFGAVPVDIGKAQIHFLVSSSNKCIEGVPGFSFIIANTEKLQLCKGVADTLTLDLHAQWVALEKDGQFRFTPPTHALLAFRQALRELEQEGGVAARSKRYQQNCQVLADGMKAQGFQDYLPENVRGYIINTYLYPQSPKFNFTEFYNQLNNRGFVIYPGKLTQADCFRVGNIGRIHVSDIQALLKAIAEVKAEMGF
jgi:2-aminoethylphosphonate-pyruvate transaminase